MPTSPDDGSVVIRISPMAHIAAAFLAIAIVVLVPFLGLWGLVFLLFPLLASVAIERYRTTADRAGATARTLTSSKTVPWTHIEGLRFTRGGWARACRQDGSEQLLPAVTFTTLPTLNEASGGRVPDPYSR